MNETNHNKVINWLTKTLPKETGNKTGSQPVEDHKIDESKINLEVLKLASKFTDSIKAADDYYYYHFYYDININGNTIQLKRVDEEEKKAFEQSMKKCGDKYDEKNLKYFDNLIQKGKLISTKREWSVVTNKKEFFSTFINGRNKSEQFSIKDLKTGGNNSLLDVGNQSDNVAFLHAMGAVGEDPSTSMFVFEEHLKKCFTEYLFILDPQKAQFILGIALHGIMDSFTPSHMGFQNYAKQDWGLHAQGDVVPFHGDMVEFDPGQAADESWYVQFFFDLKKNYNSDIHLNDKEFEMFKIYATITELDKYDEVKDVLKGKKNLKDFLSVNINPKVLGQIEITSFEPRSRAKLNKIIEYKPIFKTAFAYSDTAIVVCQKVYNKLYEAKAVIRCYDDYKKEKNKLMAENEENVISEAVKIWKESYNNFQSIRENLFNRIRENRDFTDKEKNPFTI